MKKVILLTGGSGFIGRHLHLNFRDHYLIIAPTHKQLDLTNAQQVKKIFLNNRIDIVIHCSNIGGTNRTLKLPNVVETNTKMFINIVHCLSPKQRMIYFGSGSEYDKTQRLKQIKETDFDKYIPQDSYGFSKYICSKIAEQSNNITNLRLFGVYGKFEDYQIRFISNNICRMLFNLPLTIRQNVYFDYLYIDDLIKIVDYFINHQGKYHSYNVGSGHRIDLLSIAGSILRVSNKRLPIQIIKSGFGKEYSCNISRLRQEINNLKFIPLDESIRRLIIYYQSILPTLTPPI